MHPQSTRAETHTHFHECVRTIEGDQLKVKVRIYEHGTSKLKHEQEFVQPCSVKRLADVPEDEAESMRRTVDNYLQAEMMVYEREEV